MKPPCLIYFCFSFLLSFKIGVLCEDRKVPIQPVYCSTEKTFPHEDLTFTSPLNLCVKSLHLSSVNEFPTTSDSFNLMDFDSVILEQSCTILSLTIVEATPVLPSSLNDKGTTQDAQVQRKIQDKPTESHNIIKASLTLFETTANISSDTSHGLIFYDTLTRRQIPVSEVLLNAEGESSAAGAEVFHFTSPSYSSDIPLVPTVTVENDFHFGLTEKMDTSETIFPSDLDPVHSIKSSDNNDSALVFLHKENREDYSPVPSFNFYCVVITVSVCLVFSIAICLLVLCIFRHKHNGNKILQNPSSVMEKFYNQPRPPAILKEEEMVQGVECWMSKCGPPKVMEMDLQDLEPATKKAIFYADYGASSIHSEPVGAESVVSSEEATTSL